MGSLFKYIADCLLEPSESGDCQHCERENVTSYDYAGQIVDPSLAANPELARQDKWISAACFDCINTGNIQKSSAEIKQISKVIEFCNSDVPALVARYHKIPLMLELDDDWPICCRDWCEYYGTLEEMHPIAKEVSEYRWWEKGYKNDGSLDMSSMSAGEFTADSLTGISLFACKKCGAGWFIYVVP